MLFSEGKVGREEEEQLGAQERKQTPTTITTEKSNSRNWRRKSQPKPADSPGSLGTWVTCLWTPREASVSFTYLQKGLLYEQSNGAVLLPNTRKGSFLREDEFTVKEHHRRYKP